MIENMSSGSLAMLTDGFKEQFVKAVICIGTMNYEQRKLIDAIEKGYENYMKDDPFWAASPHYPEFMRYIKLNIECGFILTKKGWEKEQRLRAKITPVTSFVQPYLSATANNEKTVEEKTIIKQAEELGANEEAERWKKEAERWKDDIEELKERIADFESRFPIKDIKCRKICAMTGKQHVILFLAVLAEHNRLPNARTNLSYLMSFIAARNESSMHDYLKDPITQKECEKLAKEFDTVCPFIAKLIRQLPDKLKEDISKKNSAKASKKVKD